MSVPSAEKIGSLSRYYSGWLLRSALLRSWDTDSLIYVLHTDSDSVRLPRVPDARELHQYIRDKKKARLYTDADTLDAASLLEGLHITLTDVFQLPTAEE